MNKIENFTFEKIEIDEAVMIGNVPHFTRRAIGEWLEYTEPAEAVGKLIARHFEIQSHSTLVNLTNVDGKKRDIPVYHPIGFLLIVMASEQPKAKAMKEQVARFVWEYGRPTNLDDKHWLAWFDRRIRLLEKIATQNNPFIIKAMADDLVYISSRLNLPVPTFALLQIEQAQQDLALGA